MPLILGSPTIIPIHQIFPYEDSIKLIDEMEKQNVPAWLGICICRRTRNLYCKHPDGHNATDIVFGNFGTKYSKLYPKAFKKITYNEARKYIYHFYKSGLIQTIYNACPDNTSQQVICNCDIRVCIPLEVYKRVGFQSFWHSPYLIRIDYNKCNLCKKCIEKCPISARYFDAVKNIIRVNYKKCIGCGVCRQYCENQAIFLSKDKNAKYILLPKRK